MTGRQIRQWCFLLCMMCLGANCAQVTSTSTIYDATREIERARVAYEFHTAEQYLYKAKEEWGYSDFQASRNFAAKAKQHAQAAVLKVKENPYPGSPLQPAQVADAIKRAETHQPLRKVKPPDEFKDREQKLQELEDVNGMFDNAE